MIASEIKIISDQNEMVRLGEIASKYHPTNFANFEKRISNYKLWLLAFIGNEPAAMCGVWRSEKWFDGLYRVGDRSFYFPIMREKTLGYDSQNRGLLSKEMLPIQMDFVDSLNGIPFISMLKNKNALRRGSESYNDLGGERLKVLDQTYYTCEDDKFENERCWQWISVLEKQEQCFNDRTLRSTIR